MPNPTLAKLKPKFLKGSDYPMMLGLGVTTFTVLDKAKLHVGYCISAGVMVFLVGLVAIFVWRASQAVEHQYELVDDFGATSHLDDLENCKRSVFVTHFVNRPPNPKYLTKMLSLLQHDNVEVTRVLPHDIDRSDPSFSWLDSFAPFAGKNYTEEVTTQRLPFDVFIFDGKVVKLTAPAHRGEKIHQRGIKFENTDVAYFFRSICDRLPSEGNG